MYGALQVLGVQAVCVFSCNSSCPIIGKISHCSFHKFYDPKRNVLGAFLKFLINFLKYNTYSYSALAYCIRLRRGSRGGEMGEFSPPLFLSPLLSFFFLIPQIMIGSITLLQQFTPYFKILDPRLV